MVTRIQRHVLFALLGTLLVALAAVNGAVLVGWTLMTLKALPGVALLDLIAFYPSMVALFARYTVPICFLFAVVWVYGRMSADRELLALRSSGVHLHTVTVPAVLLGVALVAGNLFLLDSVVPWVHGERSRLLRRTLRDLVREGAVGASTFSFSRHEIYVGDTTAEGSLYDVVAYSLEPGGVNPAQHMEAREAVLSFDTEGQLYLQLRDVDLEVLNASSPHPRAYRRYWLPLELEPDELATAQRLGGARVPPEEVRLGPAVLQVGGVGEGGELQDVTVRFHRPPRSRYAEPMTIRLQESSLAVDLGDSEARMERVDAGGWHHDFDTRLVHLLTPEERATWQEKLESAPAGDLDLQVGDLRLRGWYLGEGRFREGRLDQRRPPLRVHGARARLESSSGSPGTLWVVLEEAVAQGMETPEPTQFRLGELNLLVPLPDAARALGRRKLRDLTTAELYALYFAPPGSPQAPSSHREQEILTELHSRFAAAFAPLVFALVGVPAALLLTVRNRLAAFGICLGKVFLLYFPATVGAQALASSPALEGAPRWIPVILWVGNVLFAGLGAAYFVRLFRQ